MKKPTPPTAPPPVPEFTLTKGLRRYLYLTAAVTGAAIMVVEILGAKMLAPYVGMSHFVWTAQIAVTLVALATGYYAGGRLADQSAQLGRLYWAILAAATYLVLTVFICAPVSYWCLDFNLAVGSLLASGILFFVPLALLAMTAPFLVRTLTSSVAGVGGNVGRLTSLSTLGSFAGTMLIGYCLVPLLPNSATMCLTAVALLLVCAGYFGIYGRKPFGPLLVIFVIGSGTGWLVGQTQMSHYQRMVELFRGNSHFGQIQVLDLREGPLKRQYLNDNLTQNTYDAGKKESMSTFTYLLAGLARAYTTNISDALCIGLGVGVVPMEFAREGARVDVVEINPAVVPVAERFFDLQPEKLHITIDDGRHFLNRCQKQYDTIILDAFLGDSSPSHLLTREAFASMRRVLRPGGTLVINAFGSVEAGRDYFVSSIDRTLKAVFPGVKIHSGEGQVFFVATDRPNPEFVRLPELTAVHPVVFDSVKAAFETTVEATPGRGRVLTDDYNPVEFYDARNRENLRRMLAMLAKDM